MNVYTNIWCIKANIIWNDLQFGKLKVNCLLLKLNRQLRKILSQSNPLSAYLRWDALTTELPGTAEMVERRLYDVYWFVHATTFC